MLAVGTKRQKLWDHGGPSIKAYLQRAAPSPAQFLTHALSFQQQCFLVFCPWYLRFIFLLKWNTVPYNRAIYLPLKIFEQQNGIKTALASVGYNDFLPTEG